MANNNNQKKSQSSYSLPVRIFCIALAVLLASGFITYLTTWLINVFTR